MGWRTAIVLSGVALGAFTKGAAAGQPVGAAPLVRAAQPAVPSVSRRFRIVGQKFVAPQFQRSEAGIGWSLNDRLSLQLHYERGAYAPLMRHDHDDGLLTRLKVAF